MENLLIITFRNPQNASGALNKLSELEQLGDISIYSFATILKTGPDQFDMVKHEGSDTAGMPAVGAVGGSLIGALGGPVGMVIGMLTGTLIGSAGEDDSLDFGDTILRNVKNTMDVGDFVIVLDMEEDIEFIVDSYIEPYNGIITRTGIAEQYDRYDNKQWEKLDREIDNEEKLFKTAVGKDKASIKAKIEKLKKQRDERREKMKARSAQRKKYMEDKIKSFDEKIKTAGENTKDKLKAHRKKLREKLSNINAKIEGVFL